MTVKSKLVAAFLVLIAIIALSSALILNYARLQKTALANANNDLVQTAQNSIALVTQVKDLNSYIVQIQYNFMKNIASSTSNDNTSDSASTSLTIKTSIDRFRSRVTSSSLLAQELQSTEISNSLTNLLRDFEAYLQLNRSLDSSHSGAHFRATIENWNEYEAATDDINVQIDSLVWASQLQLAARMHDVKLHIEDANQDAQNLIYTIVAMFGLLTAVIIIIVTLLNINVVRPLSGISLALKQLARGNLSVRIPEVNRGDEIGDVAQALEVFRESQSANKDAELLKIMLNKVPLGILVVQRNGQIEFANFYARTLFGMMATDASDYRISQLLPAISSLNDPDTELGDALDQGPYLQSCRRDGHVFMSEVQVSHMENQKFLWIVRDMSRHIEAEKKKEQLEIDLRSAQKLESLGTMAGGIAHELNTPIQFVTDNMNFLSGAMNDHVAALSMYRTHVDTSTAQEIDEKYDLDYISKETPAAIQQSLDGLNRISEIVLAIKRFSYPSGSDKRLNSLNDIIQTALTVSRNQWKYVAELQLNLETDLPPIQSNAGELNQIMLNLIVNAAHAIEDKSLTETKGAIRISTRSVTGGIECIVADTGTGIKPELKEKIFDLFFTTKAPGRGTGQGLSVVHSIVTRSHRGKITVESEWGEGTKFIIFLPLSSPVI